MAHTTTNWAEHAEIRRLDPLACVDEHKCRKADCERFATVEVVNAPNEHRYFCDDHQPTKENKTTTEPIQITTADGYIVDDKVRAAYDRIISSPHNHPGVRERAAEAFLRLVERYAAKGIRIIN